MKALGILLLIAGSIWAFVALNTDTTTTTESRLIGSTYIPSQTVHNIEKINNRQNYLIFSSLIIIVGVILFAASKVKAPSPPAKENQSSDTRKCKFCAELVKFEAVICKHCGKELPKLIELRALRVSKLSDGEAMQRGILVGDVIYAFGELPTSNNTEIDEAMVKYQGEIKAAKIFRKNKQIEIPLTAGRLGITTFLTSIVIEQAP